MSNPLSSFFFGLFYVFAIIFFLESAYYIVYGISNMFKGAEVNAKQGMNIALDAFKRKLDEFEKKSEHKEVKEK